MKIYLTFDGEGPVDLEYLVGQIRIEAATAFIEVDSTYLDSWLQALIKGFRSLQAREEVGINLPEEPAPLFFSLDDGGVRVTYGGASVVGPTVGEFAAALRVVVREFLETLRALAPNQNNQILDSFRRFVAEE